MLHTSRTGLLYGLLIVVTPTILPQTYSLTTTQDYDGSEEIIMGNGYTIQISHTYNVNFNASNHQFQLNMFFSFNYYK